MVVLCLCHGGHVWVARDIAPGKMQSHFACNTGGWFLDSHVQIYLITQYVIIILFHVWEMGAVCPT